LVQDEKYHGKGNDDDDDDDDDGDNSGNDDDTNMPCFKRLDTTF
jgi:hypothetical protein